MHILKIVLPNFLISKPNQSILDEIFKTRSQELSMFGKIQIEMKIYTIYKH